MKPVGLLFISLLAKPVVRVCVSAFAALLVYGCWAYWVNRAFGEEAGIRAGVVQGSYSFFITFALTSLIEWLFRLTREWRFQVSFLSVGACVSLYLMSWCVNALAGTPDIFMTILPSALMSSLYTISYILTLKRTQ